MLLPVHSTNSPKEGRCYFLVCKLPCAGYRVDDTDHREGEGMRPFEMTPFMLFLATRFEDLRPMLRKSVPLKVALHKHPASRA